MRRHSLERKRKELQRRMGALTPAELEEYKTLTGLLKTTAKADKE